MCGLRAAQPVTTTEGTVTVDLIYRSPFEGDTDLLLDVLEGGACIWRYQGVAVAMIPPLPVWTSGLRNWYAARRDANLMGLCMICSAKMSPLPAGSVTGEMRHADDCAVIAPEWQHEYARQLTGIPWAQA
jgi:hypothetical protein